MSKSGYQACLDQVELIMAEQQNIRMLQRRRVDGEPMCREIEQLSRSCATLQSEIRKTGEEADLAVKSLPVERRVELILKMIRDLSPEYRGAVFEYLSELKTGLQ